MIPAVVYAQTDDEAAALAPTTFAELKECLEIVRRISQILRGTSRPQCKHILLAWIKLRLNAGISGLKPATEHDSSSLLKAKPVEPVSFYPYT